MEIKIFSSSAESKIAAKIALNARLFVSGWYLSHYLKRVKQSNAEAIILLAYADNIPVAVLTCDRSSGMVCVFCRKKYRRMGIGTRLVFALKSNFSKEIKKFNASLGIKGSENFFRKNGITEIF